MKISKILSAEILQRKTSECKALQAKISKDAKV